MQDHKPPEEFSVKNYFVPLTTVKAITWIIIVGLIVYANTLFNGFVWDDFFQLVQNDPVQKGQYLYYFSHTIGPYYKPLMFFVYTLIFQIFGLNSFFYHFFQLTLHLVNTIFVFFLLRYFSKNSTISFFASILFLIHPINEETAAYVADYQDVMFTFFGLAALLTTIKKPFGKYTDFAGSSLLFLSVLSKETGALFVIMYVFYIWLFRKTGRLLGILLPAIALGIYLLIRFSNVGFINATKFNFTPQHTLITESLAMRLLTIPKIILSYLTTFLLPINLTPQYWYVTSISFADFIFPLINVFLIFVLILYIGLLHYKKNKKLFFVYTFYSLWFISGLTFHLQLIPLEKTIADRWFYFPMIGLLGMFITIYLLFQIKLNKITKQLLSIILVTIFVLFTLRTMIRNTNYFSDLTLFSHDIIYLQNVPDIQDNYGLALMTNNQPEEAIIHFQKADQLLPNNYLVLNDLGTAYLRDKQSEKAVSTFEKVIKLKKDYREAYRRLIIVLMFQNNFKASKTVSQTALQMWPNDPYFLELYGLCAYKLNDYTSSVEYLQKSLLISPNPALEQDVELIKQHKSIYFTLDDSN